MTAQRTKLGATVRGKDGARAGDVEGETEQHMNLAPAVTSAACPGGTGSMVHPTRSAFTFDVQFSYDLIPFNTLAFVFLTILFSTFAT